MSDRACDRNRALNERRWRLGTALHDARDSRVRHGRVLKRLEQGRFALGRGAKEVKRELNRTALLALVEGVDIEILRQRKRYRQAA